MKKETIILILIISVLSYVIGTFNSCNTEDLPKEYYEMRDSIIRYERERVVLANRIDSLRFINDSLGATTRSVIIRYKAKMPKFANADSAYRYLKGEIQ